MANSSNYKLEDIYEILKKEENTIHTRISYSHEKKTNNKVKNLPIGVVWFNLLLPDDYELIDYQVDKKKLKKIIKDITESYDEKTSAKTVTLMNEESQKLGTVNPISFNIDSFDLPEKIKEKRDKLFEKNLKPEQFMEEVTKLAEEFLEYLKENESGIYDIVKSGARGSPTDWAVLTIARGPTINIEGKPTKIIKNSVNGGFTLEEFYQNASETRAHFFTRADATEKPGVLGRSVAFANANSKINKSDCGTKKYLELKLNDTIRDTINGRYYLNEETNKIEEITPELEFKSNSIKLRSPLYCKDEGGICSTCYGKLAEKTKSKNIGMLASSAVLTKGVKTTMGARHQSSTINIKKCDLVNDLILIN